MNFKFVQKHTLATTTVILSLGLLLIPFNNCSSKHAQPISALSSVTQEEILTSLRTESALVLEAKCATCHNQDTQDNGLTVLLDADWLDNNGFIDQGEPQDSYFYLRIVDGTMPPPPAPALNEYELSVVRDWIAAEGGNFDTYIGGTPIDGSDGNVANFNAVRLILNQNCVACHRQGENLPRLDVDANTLRAATFNGQRLVIPNNASGSLLLNSFNRMPTGEPLGLNSAEAGVLRSWINGGAL